MLFVLRRLLTDFLITMDSTEASFAGSSSILQLQKGQQPKLAGWLGRNQEGVIVCGIPLQDGAE